MVFETTGTNDHGDDIKYGTGFLKLFQLPSMVSVSLGAMFSLSHTPTLPAPHTRAHTHTHPLELWLTTSQSAMKALIGGVQPAQHLAHLLRGHDAMHFWHTGAIH